jgi:hypothetical protein
MFARDADIAGFFFGTLLTGFCSPKQNTESEINGRRRIAEDEDCAVLIALPSIRANCDATQRHIQSSRPG